MSSTSLAQLGAPKTSTAPHDINAVSPNELAACPDCGLAQRLRRPRFHQIAVCTRCRAVLDGSGSRDLKMPLAMAIAGIFLAAIANLSPLLTVRLAGIERPSLLIAGPIALGEEGLGPLGVLVAVLSILIPLIWLASVAYVLISIELGRRHAALASSFKLAERLRPLAMVDVYLLGGFVAFTRVRDIATVEIGPGGWALAALALVMIAVDALLDRRLVWDLIGPPRRPTERDDESEWALCPVCGYVAERLAAGGTAPTPRCPRCRSMIRNRKPNSVARTWALLLAGYILYLPANLLPVLTVIRFGRNQPSTIVGGVRELIAADMWPLALVVLLASVAVPLLKLGGLTWLLVSLQRKSDRNLVARTRLYRTIDAIGRWANIDIFAISTLAALVRFGAITSIEPELGAAIFAVVVIVTMLAAATFDPRLMWDAAEHRHAG